MYGPLLLARSKEIGSTEAEMFDGARIDGSYVGKITAVRTENENVRVTYDVELTNGKDTLCTTVCDYASAANQKLEDTRYFSIYF